MAINPKTSNANLTEQFSYTWRLALLLVSVTSVNVVALSQGIIKVVFSFGVFFLALSGLACGLQWSPFGSYFEGCDNQGFVLLSEKLGDLTIPDEKAPVPIWTYFTSANVQPSLYAGMWRIGIVDMSLVQIAENQFRMLDPGGNETLLTRNVKSRTILEGPGWKGLISDDRIKLWASCGWSIEFYRSKVSKIITGRNKVLNYNYMDGSFSSITCDGKAVFTLVDQGDMLEIAINGRKLSIVKAVQPRIQRVGNDYVVKMVDKSFSSVREKDSAWRNFSYSVNSNMQYVITVTERGDPFTLVWSPQTRKILRYKEWTYTKTCNMNSKWDKIELARKNDKGTVESYYHDQDAGLTIIQRGTFKRSEYCFSSGPAMGKIRKIEEMTDGKVTHLQQYFYDEKGRVIRGRENEDILKFMYDDKNHTSIAWRNNVFLWKKVMDEQGRLLKGLYPDGKELRYTYNKEGQPIMAELVDGGRSIAAQLNVEGLVKAETAIIRDFPK